MRSRNHRLFLVPLVFVVLGEWAPCRQANPVLTPKEFQSDSKDPVRAKTNQESIEKLAARAEAAMEADRVPEAIGLYDRATKLRPNWSEGWWHLGTLLFDSRRFDEARDAFAHFLATERKQPGPGFAMLGLTEFELKHYEKALAALERGLKPGVEADPAFARTVLLHDGMLQALLGKPEIALQRLTLAANQIAAEHPEAPRNAVFADTELQDALGIAALQLKTVPSDLDAEKGPLVRQAGRAQVLIALQDRVRAAAEFQTLLAQFSTEPGVNYMYGVFLLKEHPSEAVAAFRRELEVSPSHATARIQLALQLLETADYEEGLNYAKRAVELAPQNFVAHVACGRLYLALGKNDLALDETRAAVKLAPRSPDAHFALSRVLSEAGRNEEAARERREFERLKALSDAANR